MVRGDVVAQVRRFFATHRADLKLPDGWYGGRPMENLHALTWVEARPHRLVIELDDHLLLSFVGDELRVEERLSTEVLVSGTPALLIAGYQHCTFESLEYGNLRPHLAEYMDGEVWFVAATT